MVTDGSNSLIEEDRMSTLVLVGNGFSISYNPDLAIGPLTAKVLTAFDSGAGGDAAVLQQFTAALGSKSHTTRRGNHAGHPCLIRAATASI